MKESLISIKKKYKELLELLKKPDIVSNINKYRKISQEISLIKDVSQTFEKYEKYEKNIKESNQILKNEKDEEILEMAKEEINEANNKLKLLEEDLKILLLPKDINDEKNVIIEIHGAAGGDEANIFAGDLFEIYKKWSSLNKMKIKLLDSTISDSGGYSSIVFKVEGEKAYSKLKFESGVHRVQRVPSTETQGRIHTSTAKIIVMPEADETVKISINKSDIKKDTYRASGAGGQHINTTDSAVRLTHVPSGIVVQSQDGRSQIANAEIAMQHLKTKLYELEVKKKQEESASFRKLSGSGARSEKIRTYNYPQDRVTDHRINFSCSLKSVLEGKINSIIDSLLAEEQLEKIKEAGL